MNSINQSNHKKRIHEALQEIERLQHRTCHPAPIPHQFIGTALDNSFGLLTAPANALGEHINFSYSNFENWLSLMKSVHRAFFSNIHSCFEKSISYIAIKRNIQIESSISKQYLTKVERIRDSIGEELSQSHLALSKIEKYFKNIKPGFKDTFNAVIKASRLTEARKTTWRTFFEALTIARNKSSHSDPTLTKHDVCVLKSGGFETLIDENNNFQCNPLVYAQVGKFCLDFLDELLANLSPAKEN